MAYLNPRVQDFGLISLKTEADRVHVCTAEPATYADAVARSLGSHGVQLSGPSRVSGTDRKVTVPEIFGGSIAGTGRATHWALVDSASGRLSAAGPLGTPQQVTAGNLFNLPSIDIVLSGV
jgi:hypothetical protein